jgi:hypothetical protein
LARNRFQRSTSASRDVEAVEFMMLLAGRDGAACFNTVPPGPYS